MRKFQLGYMEIQKRKRQEIKRWMRQDRMANVKEWLQYNWQYLLLLTMTLTAITVIMGVMYA